MLHNNNLKIHFLLEHFEREKVKENFKSDMQTSQQWDIPMNTFTIIRELKLPID